MQQTYLAKSIFEEWEQNDPLLHSARLLTESGVLTADEVLSIYTETEEQCARVAEEVIQQQRLSTSQEVMASIVPPKRECKPTNGPSERGTRDCIRQRYHNKWKNLNNMSRLINWALTDLMLEYPEIIMMGEDVGRKGGVYGVTQKLCDRFGQDRVIDTLLDEQSILGLAIGLGHNGFIPLPEIQFLAYLHNAEDQIRGEAATLSFFSNGQFTNPMVLRIAGLGLPKRVRWAFPQRQLACRLARHTLV